MGTGLAGRAWVVADRQRLVLKGKSAVQGLEQEGGSWSRGWLRGNTY